MEGVYSNRIAQSSMDYVDRNYGKHVTDTALERCNLDRLRLSDSSGFHSSEETQALTLACMEVTGDKDIAYHMGRDLPKSLGKLGGFIVGVTSPAFLMRSLGQVEAKFARKTINKTVQIGRGKFQVDVTFRDGFMEFPPACRNRLGSYESTPLFFGLPYARVEHPKCAHKGDDHCVYIIHFPDYGWSLLNRVFQLLSVLALVLLGLWLAGTGRPWTLPTGLAASSLGFLSYAMYRHLGAKRSLEWAMLSNEGLTKQNSALETTNFRVHSLQDLTTTLSATTKVQLVCDKVVDVLVGEFHYGSSQIWLVDAEGKFLSCQSAVGYSPDLLAFITNTRFSMNENWDNPYGLLMQTMVEKKTLIVNDVEELLPKLTGRTQEFLRALNISSFVITPLLQDGKAIGILAAEHHKGEKIEHQDRLLFQSISNIVANALAKANLIEGMEQKIEQRTRELETATNQLMAAKEMAIQSEKLSSLGQMAAGVAHEINNPLNFLVNIMPDVRRDLEALDQIRKLALEDGSNAGLASRVRQIDDKYELASHLEEKDFVFERIQKALDKSTRIANSLKVFSRTSAKEKISREGFADMLREVVELIPQKVKGDTVIDLEIPSDLGWMVNKNEIEQAFLALINNAIDAMGQKGRIRIQALTGLGELTLAFKDEGPGIPQETLKRIFDPFYTTKPPGKGTGLGLTIASEIVRKYGGILSATSEPGKGATFFIRFRREATMEEAQKAVGNIQAA